MTLGGIAFGQRTRTAAVFVVAAAVALIPFRATPAAAEVISTDPHERSITAPDGMTLLVGHRAEHVERVESASASSLTALVESEAYAMVAGREASRLAEAELVVGYHVGCAVALASLSAGVATLLSAIGLNMAEGALTRKSTIVVKPDDSQPAPKNNSHIYPGTEIAPSSTVILESGAIADIPTATVPMRNDRAIARVHRANITVDGCIGPVAIRSYAALAAESALTAETVVVYGDPVLL